MSSAHEKSAQLAQGRFHKKRRALLSFCEQRNFTMAKSALLFAEQYHAGLRKDDITPEFEHQLDISFYVIKLKGVNQLEQLLAIALLHDLREDYGHLVSEHDIELITGPELAKSVALLNKYHPDGSPKKKKAYYREMALDPLASLAKGLDRIHNMYAMRGVFDIEKQLRYARDVTEYIIPMLQKAAHAFPHQILAYERLCKLLTQQVAWVNTHANAVQNNNATELPTKSEMNESIGNPGL